MNKFFNRLISFFKSIKNNIAFYPTVIAFIGFVFALLMIFFEQQGVSKYLIDTMPMLVIEDGNTALTVMSVCIGGLISMMVFSFSMVMLLLSQASSNFSPRLLPGLISDKRHQSILGLYLASIIYNVFIMLSIEPTGEKYTLPGFSVLLGILATIVCLGAFIYFIHNMSQSIQISIILDDIYEKADKRLKDVIEYETVGDEKSFADSATWYAYPSQYGGYFQHLSISNILTFCNIHNTKLHIVKPKGLFVLKNETFIRSEKELNDEQLKKLYASIYFSKNELVSDNYTLAFKQITEIIVKAMSPGINDPGTAVNAIDYLTELFALRLQKQDYEIICNKDANGCIKIETIYFENLLYNVMASLRTYCKHDPIIVQKLLLMLNYLKKQPSVCSSYKEVVEEQIALLLNVAENSFETKKDKAMVKALAEK